MGLLHIYSNTLHHNKTPIKRKLKSYKNSSKTKVGSKRKLGFEHHSPKQEVGHKRDLNFQNQLSKTRGGV